MAETAMVLLYNFTSPTEIGSAPLFDVCLLFGQTEGLFQKCLLSHSTQGKHREIQ